MHHDYADIRDRIAEPPRWFDEHGAPRYCTFAPGEAGNVYAAEAVLLRISCQGCGHEFDVAMTGYDKIKADAFGLPVLSDLAERDALHYGDPPNVNCCVAGPTMNSVPERVLEFWHRNAATGHEWTRRSELERDVPHAWATGLPDVDETAAAAILDAAAADPAISDDHSQA